MKLVKMSLVAAMVMGASAFAIDNVKVSGDAKLYYSTSDVGNTDLFDKGNVLGGTAADTALRIGMTGDLLKGVSFGVTGYAVSTLGLENNLVGNVWSGAHGLSAAPGASFGPNVQVDDAFWVGELWMAATMGKTTAKVGRMELDTPLAFSEKWNIAPNTFEAAVLINQDLPDTTFVAAWIGKSNGANGGVVGTDGKFSTLVTDGAYAVGAINNSFKPLTAQAWYYNVSDVADAYWLQADINCQLVPGVKIGAQYAEMSPKAAGDDTEAYAVMVGYAKDALSLSAAYSEVDNKGVLPMANVATGFGQSKLYTEASWGMTNFGYVGAIGAEAWNIKGSYDIKDIAKVCASYTDVENDVSNVDMKELALAVSKSFGPLDAKLQYVSTDADDQNAADRFNTLNVYLTLNF
jgi:imipenem/basic amino acid-specific outer membrane pore